MHYNHHQSIWDQSWPRLPMTTSGTAQQGTFGNHATAKHSKNRREEKGK